MHCVKNEPEVDEKLTRMRAIVELESLDLARYVTPTRNMLEYQYLVTKAYKL